ncbi:MAG: MqnA/MqnD/SBP family protein, partial [Planctomycetota bacterium]
MTRRIHLGLSTCPNDTFLAHALLTGALETPGLEFEIELLDVQALKERHVAGDF